MSKIFSHEYGIVIDTVPTEDSIDNIVSFSRNVKHYLHCSSVMSYAPLSLVPGDETMPFSNYMGLGEKKNIVDSKVIKLFEQGKLPATVIRPGYIAGPGRFPLDNLGGRREDFIPDILNGKILDLPNAGKALLHPVHVRDVSESFLLAVKHPESIGQIYNICGEKAITTTKYLELNTTLLDRKIKINYMPLEEMVKKYKDTANELGMRFFAEHMCYDISKARTELEYIPGYDTIQTIEEAARWAAKQVS